MKSLLRFFVVALIIEYSSFVAEWNVQQFSLMDYFAPNEDPRHTAGKRHSYAKELPSAFLNNNSKSRFSDFITTPPVTKPHCYFPSTGYVANTARLYQAK